ncbi:MAG: DUF3592 domain-containing protein [Phyllobacterium sp.]
MEKFTGYKLAMSLVTLVLFCGFGLWVLHVRSFVNSARQGRGHVVRMVEEPTKSGRVYKPVIEFQTAEGDRITFESSSGSAPPAYRVGEDVTVFYDPSDPQSALPDDWFALWGGPAILGVLSLIFAALTYLRYFRLSFKRPGPRGS